MAATIAQPVLNKPLQDVLTEGLNFLVAHNVKGASLIQNAIIKVEDFIEHNAILHSVLKIMSPIFSIVDSIVETWITANCPALLPVYRWAKSTFATLQA